MLEENVKRPQTSLALACCHGNSSQAGRAAHRRRLPQSRVGLDVGRLMDGGENPPRKPDQTLVPGGS